MDAETRDLLFEPLEGELDPAAAALSTRADDPKSVGLHTALQLSFSLRRGSLVWLSQMGSTTSTQPPSPHHFGSDPFAAQSLNSEALAEFEFRGLHCSLQRRAGVPNAGFSLSLDLESVSLFDRRQSEPGARPLIGPKPATLIGSAPPASVAGPFFQSAIRFNDPEFRSDIDVALYVRPLQVTLDPLWLGRVATQLHMLKGAIQEAALPQPELSASSTTEAGGEDDMSAGDKTWARLMGGVTNASAMGGSQGPLPSLSLDLDIQAPLVIMSDAGHDGHPEQQHFIILDLGCLRASNAARQGVHRAHSTSSDTFVTPPSSPTPEDNVDLTQDSDPARKCDDDAAAMDPQTLALERAAEAHQIGSHASGNTEWAGHAPQEEKFLIELSDMQMLSARGVGWMHALQAGELTRSHVIGQFTVLCTLARSIQPSSTQRPRLTIKGQLPALNFSLDEARLEAILACVTDLSAIGLMTPSSRSGANTPRGPENGMPLSASVIDAAATRAGGEFQREWHDSISGRSSVQLSADDSFDGEAAAAGDIVSRLLEFDFELDHLGVLLESQQPLARAVVTGIKVSFVQRPHKESLTFGIEHVEVADLTQEVASPYYYLVTTRELLSGKADEPCEFVKLTYTQRYRGRGAADRASGQPRRSSIAVDGRKSQQAPPGPPRQLELFVDHIHINFNRETIANLLDFANAAMSATFSSASDLDDDASGLSETVVNASLDSDGGSTSQGEGSRSKVSLQKERDTLRRWSVFFNNLKPF